jgi:hypothetical protein
VALPEQAAVVGGGEGRFEHHAVVAVGGVGDPGDGDTVGVSEQRPLPATYATIHRRWAGSLTSGGCLVLAAVDAAVAEVEPDDAVIGGDGLCRETVEHTGGDPLVAPRPRRRVGHGTAEQPLDIDPRATGDEPDQDPLEAGPIRDARPVAAQRMGVARRREQTRGRTSVVSLASPLLIGDAFTLRGDARSIFRSNRRGA